MGVTGAECKTGKKLFRDAKKKHTKGRVCVYEYGKKKT